MTKLKLYDTYTRSLREFEPLTPPEVGLYTCGPTVYNFAHIGNLRTYIFEDVLRRVLEFNNFPVKHVMNITDVGHLVSDSDTGEDKMESGSRRTGMTAWEIAELYTEEFKKDMRRLNIQEPTIWCRATDHIKEQIEFVRCIEENGYTYQTSDGIYFDTSRLDDYGYLGRLNIEGLQAGMRVDMGEKRNPTDFALWKFSPKGQQRQDGMGKSLGNRFPRLAYRMFCHVGPLPGQLLRHPPAAARIISTCITPMKSPRPKPATAPAWPISGCTGISCKWGMTPRCPSPAENSCGCRP